MPRRLLVALVAASVVAKWEGQLTMDEDTAAMIDEVELQPV